MMVQQTMFGNATITNAKLKKHRSSNSIISGECCEACYKAKETVCTCRCGGHFHGLGNPRYNKNQKSLGDKEEDYDVLDGLRRARLASSN